MNTLTDTDLLAGVAVTSILLCLIVLFVALCLSSSHSMEEGK